MAKKRIFISFDYDNDAKYKNMLLAWDKNNEFDFELYNGSLKEAINSQNATYIKSKIRPLINKASHLLCLVGKASAASDLSSVAPAVSTTISTPRPPVAARTTVCQSGVVR